MTAPKTTYTTGRATALLDAGQTELPLADEPAASEAVEH